MINLTTEVQGLFKFEAFKVDSNGAEVHGSRRVLADWFPNLITDNGLNLIGSSSTWLTYCQVGSGSTAPAVTQSALSARIGTTSNKSSDSSGAQSEAPYYAWRRLTYRFAAGSATGNISEVGVGGSTSDNLLSRALILDAGGNPTTITVLSDETLDVTYEFRYYVPTVDWEGALTLGGVATAVRGRAANVTSSSSQGWSISLTGGASPDASSPAVYTGNIGLMTEAPTGTSSSTGAVSNTPYVNGTFRKDAVITWNLTSGNLTGGIGAIRVKLGIGTYQFGFTPVIAKDTTKTLTLTFRHSWARKTL